MINFFDILILIIAFNSILFIFASFKKDNSIIDIFYSWGFMLATIFSYLYFYFLNTLTPEKILLSLLVLAWGVRLSFRIYSKNKHKPEDFRYAAWREEWSKKGKTYFYLRSFLQIFVLQGLIASAIVLPSAVFNSGAEYFYFGLALAVFGLIYEGVGDWQLDKFIAEKRGGIMQDGLWKYSRHPNYFGEATFWWGVFIATFTTANWWMILSPLLITYLLRFVSGVPMLEKRWDTHPDEAIRKSWLAYKAKTNAMVPWF